MSRRIEVELTSERGDGSWTWRAAGARQPKGTLDGNLLPSGATVGQVLRADADFDVDGVTIVAVLPPAAKKRNEAERIELIAPVRRDDELVTANLVSGSKTDRGDRRDRRDRGDRGDRGDRPARPGGDRNKRGGPGERTGPGERRPQGTGGERRPQGAPGERGPQGAGEQRRSERPPRTEGGDRPPRTERRPARPPRPEEPQKPKPKRLRAGRAHQQAVLAELPPEHRPIAEQVLRGDIPAVRQAIEKENEGRAARGEAPIDGRELLAIAEKLRPRLRTADWHDRAEAALADVDELDLRDLRSVVVAADSAARDDETRALAAQLREALARRVEHAQSEWVHELESTLAEGRVVRALRISSRPPKAGAILKPELMARLTAAAGAALSAEAPSERWAIVLDAITFSPVRLAVRPQSLPETPSEELLATIRKVSTRVPDIAAAFGIEPTKPPRTRPPRGKAKPGAPKEPKPIPAPPAREVAEAPAAPAAPAPLPATEATPEAPADTAAEPVAEAATEVAPEPAAEPAPEVSAEPAAETAPEAEPVAEAPAEEPAAETVPVPEAQVEPEAVADLPAPPDVERELVAEMPTAPEPGPVPEAEVHDEEPHADVEAPAAEAPEQDGSTE
jgi:hypothetical protein